LRTNRAIVTKLKKLPPGHAKKLNGDKSAKRYAPGHNNNKKDQSELVSSLSDSGF
jgi:hypothetical protein